MVLTYSDGGMGTKHENDEIVWNPLRSGWEGEVDKIKEIQEVHSHPGAGDEDSIGAVGQEESLSQHAGGVPSLKSAVTVAWAPLENTSEITSRMSANKKRYLIICLPYST